MNRSFLVLVTGVGSLLLVTPFPLAAYIDPGTGYLILQLIAAAVVGSAVFARRQIRRAGRWVGGLFGGGGDKEGNQGEEGS